MPISRTTVLTLSSSGNAWLIGPSRPKAAATAVRASSTGTSAATTAPNANSRTSRVTGTESSSARRRSPLTTRSRAMLAEMSPVSSIVTFGCAAPAASTEARNSSIESEIVTKPVTSAECRSRETRTADIALEPGAHPLRNVRDRAPERRVAGPQRLAVHVTPLARAGRTPGARRSARSRAPTRRPRRFRATPFRSRSFLPRRARRTRAMPRWRARDGGCSSARSSRPTSSRDDATRTAKHRQISVQPDTLDPAHAERR